MSYGPAMGMLGQIVLCVGAAALCCSGQTSSPQEARQSPVHSLQDPRPIVLGQPLRENPFYRFNRVFFPKGRPFERFDRPKAMDLQDWTYASAELQTRAADLEDWARIEAPALVEQMKLLGVRTPPRLLVDQPVTLELVNDGSSTAEAIAGSSVLVSPRVIKGFLSGSARKIASDDTPMSSMLRAYVGWGVSGPDEDGREWLKRYSQFLDVIERVGPYTASVEQQQAFGRRMVVRVDADSAPADFASVYHDVAIAGRPPSVDQELAMSEFLFMAQTMVLDPALKFLLAHEIGHVALGHTSLAAADCRERQRIELDADAFAITLLSYEPMGIVEAIQYQAAAPTQSTKDFVEEAMSTEAQLERFGFVQALGYGMEETGLGEGQGCALISSAKRAEQIRSSLRSVMTARLDAIRPFVLYMNEHPNVGALRDTDHELASDDIRDLLRDGVEGCKGAPAKQEVQRQTEPWMPYRFRYVVRCIVLPPPVGTITPRDRQLAGWLWRSSFDRSYKPGS